MLFCKLLGLLVIFKHAVLRAGFNRHVRHAEAVFHREAGKAFACELHRLIERAVHADHADDLEDDIFAGYPLFEFAF